MNTNKIVVVWETEPPVVLELARPLHLHRQFVSILTDDLPLDVVTLTDRPGGLDMWVRDTSNIPPGAHVPGEPNLVATAVAAVKGTMGVTYRGPAVFASTEIDEGAGELRMAGLSEEQLDDLVHIIETFRHVYGYPTWKVLNT